MHVNPYRFFFIMSNPQFAYFAGTEHGFRSYPNGVSVLNRTLIPPVTERNRSEATLGTKPFGLPPQGLPGTALLDEQPRFEVRTKPRKISWMISFWPKIYILKCTA